METSFGQWMCVVKGKGQGEGILVLSESALLFLRGQRVALKIRYNLITQNIVKKISIGEIPAIEILVDPHQIIMHPVGANREGDMDRFIQALFAAKTRFEETGVSALTLDAPRNAKEWYLLGQRCLAEKDFSGGILAFTNALQGSEPYFAAWAQLGLALNVEKQLDDARIAYEQALFCAPNDPDLWGVLGTLLHEQKSDAEALYCWERAIQLGKTECQGPVAEIRGHGIIPKEPLFVTHTRDPRVVSEFLQGLTSTAHEDDGEEEASEEEQKDNGIDAKEKKPKRPSATKGFLEKGAKKLTKAFSSAAGDFIGDKIGEATGNKDLGKFAGTFAGNTMEEFIAPHEEEDSGSAPRPARTPSSSQAHRSPPSTPVGPPVDLTKRLLGILRTKRVVKIDYIQNVLKLPREEVIGMIYELVGGNTITGEFDADDTTFTLHEPQPNPV